MEQEELRNNIDPDRIPDHIAVIMDGNGRWAQKQGVKRLFGHQNAIEAVRNVTESAAEIGVGYLSLYMPSQPRIGIVLKLRLMG